MTAPDAPTPGEMWRRMDDLRDEMRGSFASLNDRLDKVPTSELLSAYMRTWDAQLATVREDVDELKAEQTHQRRETRQARQWAVSGVVIPLATALIALVALLNGWAT